MSGRTRPVGGTTTIDELLAECPAAMAVFTRRRMYCPACLLARFETLADACRFYGQSLDALLLDIAEFRGTREERPPNILPADVESGGQSVRRNVGLDDGGTT